MTNLEAIKGRLGHPLSDNGFKLALTNRGLTDSEIYLASSAAFDLAYADSIVTLLTTPDISEGGYSIKISEKKMLIDLAGSIYKKCGVENLISFLKPRATFKSVW
jgi:hypothetical protein